MSAPGQAAPQGFAPLEQLPETRVLQRYDEEQAAKGNAEFALSALQTPSLYTVYESGMPIRMVSALDPTALKQGEFSLLQNVRPDGDVIAARRPTTLFGGATSFSPSLPGGSLPRGVWSGNLNGTVYVYTAWYDGTAVRIYSSSDGINFTERTATSGAYGNTRMTDSGGNVVFQSVTDLAGPIPYPNLTSYDYLIVQNGVDLPRLIRTTALNGAYAAPMQTVQAPLQASAINPVVVWDVALGCLTGSYSPGSKIVAGIGTAGSTTAITLTSGIAAGDSTSITLTGAYGISGNMLYLACDQAVANHWDNIQITLYDNVLGNIVVHDPTDASVSAPVAQPWDGPQGFTFNGGGCVLGISLATFAGTHVSKVIFKWVTSNPIYLGSSGYTFNIFGTWTDPGGSIPYGYQYAISSYCLGSRTESAGVVCGGLPQMQTQTIVYNGSTTTSATLPYASGYYYEYSFIMPLLPASSVDYYVLYAAPPGSTQFFFCLGFLQNVYSGGSWTTYSGFPNLIDCTQVNNYSFILPSAYATCVPKGTCMASGGGRTFVGQGSLYWFSEYQYPTRYSLILDVENGVARAGSGGYVQLPSSEKCAAWAVTGASALGTNNLYLFTNQSTYGVTGPDGQSLSTPTLLAAVGCPAPGSVAVYQDSIFFLDDNYQIRRFSYGKSQFYFYQNVNSYDLMQPISKRVVDDRTRGIPSGYVSSAVGCATYDRYYLAYTPSGATSNQKMLVFDQTIGSFVEDTPGLSNVTIGAMTPTTLNGAKKVFVQSGNLQCYDWENTSSSAPVSVQLSTAAMSAGMFTKTFFGRVGVVADTQGTGSSLLISKSLIAGGNAYGTLNSDGSSISFDPATVQGGQVFRWDSKTLGDGTTGPAGMTGIACQLSFGPLSMIPGTRIMAIVQEQAVAAPGADAL